MKIPKSVKEILRAGISTKGSSAYPIKILAVITLNRSVLGNIPAFFIEIILTYASCNQKSG